MPAGLQCWRADGSLVLDTSTRLATFVGTVNTGTSAGSIWTDTTKGTPWAFAAPIETPRVGHLLPNIWFEGNTLKWAWENVQWTSPRAVLITYGYF